MTVSILSTYIYLMYPIELSEPKWNDWAHIFYIMNYVLPNMSVIARIHCALTKTAGIPILLLVHIDMMKTFPPVCLAIPRPVTMRQALALKKKKTWLSIRVHTATATKRMTPSRSHAAPKWLMSSSRPWRSPVSAGSSWPLPTASRCASDSSHRLADRSPRSFHRSI